MKKSFITSGYDFFAGKFRHHFTEWPGGLYRKKKNRFCFAACSEMSYQHDQCH